MNLPEYKSKSAEIKPKDYKVKDYFFDDEDETMNFYFERLSDEKRRLRK